MRSLLGFLPVLNCIYLIINNNHNRVQIYRLTRVLPVLSNLQSILTRKHSRERTHLTAIGVVVRTLFMGTLQGLFVF
jgi:hypothetical protein